MMDLSSVTKTPTSAFSIDSIMSRDLSQGGSPPALSMAGPHSFYPSPEMIHASQAAAAAQDLQNSQLRTSLHQHLLAQETALLASKPMYSQAAQAVALGLSPSAGLDHPMLPAALGAAFGPQFAGHPDAAALSSLHSLQARAAMSQTLASSAAAAAALGVPKHPLHMYSWLSRPAFFAHRLPGSEPSFLLPFRKPKRIRTAFSPSQLLRLEHAFEKNHYVVGQERKDLAANLGLTETQVKVWFQNRRTKYKRVKSDEECDGTDIDRQSPEPRTSNPTMPSPATSPASTSSSSSSLHHHDNHEHSHNDVTMHSHPSDSELSPRETIEVT